MNNIPIEHGIPVPVLQRKPSKGGKPGPEPTYPFAGLDVSDSFFVPDATIRRLSAAAAYWQRKTGWKFKCRTVDGGVRVWRIQ